MTAPDGPPLLVRIVGPDEGGQRADVLLARWLEEPRARTQARLAAGEVTLDGQRVVKARRVSPGDRLEVALPPAPAPRLAPPVVPVRYEDDDLLVVAKPAGLVVHPGAGHRGPTLVDALRAADIPLAAGGDPGRPGIVHRLDRGTSGLLVVAKSEEARLALVTAFKSRTVERAYWGLTDGVPEPARATIDAPIARSATQRTRFVADPAGRRAVTHYDVVEAFSRAAVLEVRLDTGRTHQVRVHLAAIGHPVAGDRAYGASPSLAAHLGLERPALHARRVALVHPLTGERLVVEEPLPDDLANAVETLRRLP